MSAILIGAANIIVANGLARGEYVDLTAGDPPLPIDQCPMCPRSAIASAAGQYPLFVVEWPMHCDGGYDGSEAERAAYAEIATAEAALARYLRAELGRVDDTDKPIEARLQHHFDTVLIEEWADEDGRTANEVVGGLRAAAEYQPVGAR